MLDAHWVNARLVARRQVQMLRPNESLVNERLLYEFLVEFRFGRVTEQVLVKIFHDAFLNSFAVEVGCLVALLNKLFRKDSVEYLGHFTHELLDVLALLLAVLGLHYLRQNHAHKSLDFLPNWLGLVAFQFLVELVEDALLR